MALGVNRRTQLLVKGVASGDECRAIAAVLRVELEEGRARLTDFQGERNWRADSIVRLTVGVQQLIGDACI